MIRLFDIASKEKLTFTLFGAVLSSRIRNFACLITLNAELAEILSISITVRNAIDTQMDCARNIV